jgi:Rrf2 family transcriptional regulator, iron-sulfur cluster assembly transcription factor
MKITAIEEYGLRVAVQLGREGPGGSLTIPEIAEREGLSTAYVAKLLAMLRQGELVTSARGRSGGYTLSRPAEQITASEVLRVFGGRIWDSGYCERHAGTLEACIHLGRCSVRTLWGQLESAVDQLLRNVTLEDLVDGQVPRREPMSRIGVVQAATTAAGKEE